MIRAVEHLSNTPRQIFIATALGYDLPTFAHLPYVAEPGSAEKLSKRKLSKYLKNHEFKKAYDHGAAIAEALDLPVAPEAFSPVVVDFYRDIGYEPDALVNYLLLLGWSLDDHTETFSRDQMIEHFSLERVNRSPASFDPQKLLAFQERRMQALSLESRVERVLPFAERAGFIDSPPAEAQRARVVEVVRAADARLKVAGDILDYREFFQADAEVAYDEKAFAKRVRKVGVEPLLRRFRDRLAALDPFDAESADRAMHDFVETEGIGIGQIIHAVRVAVTGKAVGFGLFEGLAILGRDACVARIDRALEQLVA